MNNIWDKDYFKKRKRRKEVISFDHVEEVREKFGYKKFEFADLMGISVSHYHKCENKGLFPSFNFYAATDAIENVVYKKAFADIFYLHKIKTGLSLSNDDNIDDSSDESEEQIT